MPSVLLPKKGKFGLIDYEKMFCRRGVAQAAIDHIHECVVVEADDVTRLNLGDAVGPNELTVRPDGQDLAFQTRSRRAASADRHNAPLAGGTAPTFIAGATRTSNVPTNSSDGGSPGELQAAMSSANHFPGANGIAR
jgi:hypothetical protein